VIPDTLLGLLLFIGAIGPGYVWLLVVERRRPSEERSAILEAAELSFVGILSTGVAAFIVLGVVDGWESLGVDTSALATDGGKYLLQEPIKGIGTLLAIFGLSFGLAWGAAQIGQPDDPPIKPGFNVWDRVFSLTGPEKVFVTAELRDRRRFSGYVHAWDVGTGEEDRDLSLQAPIKVRPPGGPEYELSGVHFLALQQEEIVWLSATWDPPPAVTATAA